MRSFPSFKRQKNFTGLYYAATMGAHVGFESWLERDSAVNSGTSCGTGWIILARDNPRSVIEMLDLHYGLTRRIGRPVSSSEKTTFGITAR